MEAVERRMYGFEPTDEGAAHETQGLGGGHSAHHEVAPTRDSGTQGVQGLPDDKGDEEAQRYDKDYIEALEHGMPPTCGFGVSERLFSFLMDKPVRDCQIFPLMKPKQ